MSDNLPPLKLGIAGLGTVGGGTLSILKNQAEMLAARCGRKLEVIAICARDKNKKRDLDTSNIKWVENPVILAQDPEIDVVVELIGGADGAAKTLVETALTQGKSVVTANKALMWTELIPRINFQSSPALLMDVLLQFQQFMRRESAVFP